MAPPPAAAAGEPPRRRTRRARARGAGAAGAGAAAAASATLALAWLILLNTPVPSDGFFRPSTRGLKPPARGATISALPSTRPSSRGLTGNEQQGAVVPTLPLQRLTTRYSSSALLMSREEGEETDEEGEEEGEEGGAGGEGSDGVELPAIKVPEMMSDEVCVLCFMCVVWVCALVLLCVFC